MLPLSQPLMQHVLWRQGEFSALAKFLGEKEDADTAAVFGLVWEFTNAFDEAYATFAAAEELAA